MALHSLRRVLGTSFEASIGDIVFGMEDGTVSIFDLVAGVALTASSGKSVLVAAAGEIAGLMQRLGRTGLQPAGLPELERSATVSSSSQRQQPVAHAMWLSVSDLFAGLTPVLTTVSIAGCAALAGVAVGLWLDEIG